MKSKKIVLILLIILLVTIVSLTFLNNTKNNRRIKNENMDNTSEQSGFINFKNLENAKIKNGVKYNTSKKIKEDHIAGNYKFSDMKIYSNDCCSILKFNIYNKVDKNTNKEIIIEFYNNKNELIYSFGLWLKQNDINKGIIEKNIPEDIINAYDYKVFGLD